MCYYLFFKGHMELRDKIISSILVSKLTDFVMFVSYLILVKANISNIFLTFTF